MLAPGTGGFGMNFTGYMEENIPLPIFSGILFKEAILFAELNQTRMHSFLPEDSLFRMLESLHAFLLSSAPENLTICAIFNTEIIIITDCKKDTLTK